MCVCGGVCDVCVCVCVCVVNVISVCDLCPSGVCVPCVVCVCVCVCVERQPDVDKQRV